jgi:hypothetical protein
MFVFVVASLALAGYGAWWLWRRRRQLALVGADVRVYWEDERTLYATYEDLGMIRPPGATTGNPDATECLDMDAVVGVGESDEAEATACLDLAMMPMMAMNDSVPAAEPEATACLNMGMIDIPTLAAAPDPTPPPPPPSFEPAPAFEPKHTFEPAAVTPPEPAPTPRGIGIGPGELTTYFDDAVEAYEIWRAQMAKRRSLTAIASSAERDWLDAMALLKTGNAAARDQLLRPALQRHDSHRVVAALSLLEHGEAELAVALEQRSLDELFEALLLWRSPTAQACFCRLAIAQFPKQAGTWARLLRARGFDPGAELLAKLLGAKDPGLVAAGLGLIALHEERDAHHGAVMSHMFEPDPELRAAAVEAGLRLRIDVAWIHCRQLATTSGRSRTCELVASLSSPAEQQKLIEWASRKSAPPHALWCAALTGRSAAIELAITQLESRNRLARRCLVHLTGNKQADAQWWQAHAAQFSDDHRWLGGERLELASVLTGIAELPAAHRVALTLELGVRDPSLAPLPLDGYADELHRALEQLGKLNDANLDFERGYPWTTP